MVLHGELLDANSDPERVQLYTLFDEYFNHPILTKTKDVKDEYSVYMAKMYCLLLTSECRYLIVFIEKDDHPIGNKEHLEDLYWVSLQTRTLPKIQVELPTHSYQVNSKGGLMKRIDRYKSDNIACYYECKDLPLTCTILHKKDNNPNEYHNTGTIVSAIETYETVITLK